MSTLTLTRDPSLDPANGPVAIIVLDGVGIGRGDETDAVHLARTPTLDWLDEHALRTTLLAHGTHVGMPSDGDMGNSEVGHNALGAGRIFDQGATLVANAVGDGSLFEGEVWRAGVDCVGADGTLHLLGLLSDGNVHSHIDHVFAMIRRAADDGVRRLRVHPLSDGRDVGATTALSYIEPLEALLAELSVEGRDYRIASGGGRMITTMDRYEADWSIVERGWNAHVHGCARPFQSATQAIETLRAESPGISDQNLPAWVVVNADQQPVGRIVDGDAVLFWNFRGDRAIEITRAFESDETFDAFDRGAVPDVFFAGMMQYDGDLGLPKQYLVTPPSIDRPMGEWLAGTGLRQLAVSETQKYGHVTYFWNGNRSSKFSEALETWIEVPSDRVSFDERPWMKAAEITDATLASLDGPDAPHVVRINYPNGDMVGHTGDREAAILSVEATDLCLRRLLDAILARGGVAIVTADHGNADQMYQVDKKTGAIVHDEAGRPVPMTSHTLNPVPLWIADSREDPGYLWNESLSVRRLSNVAATVFQLLGYHAPDDYDPSLITQS